MMEFPPCSTNTQMFSSESSSAKRACQGVLSKNQHSQNIDLIYLPTCIRRLFEHILLISFHIGEISFVEYCFRVNCFHEMFQCIVITVVVSHGFQRKIFSRIWPIFNVVKKFDPALIIFL